MGVGRVLLFSQRLIRHTLGSGRISTMYTMVLMMAVTSSGDVSSFGHHRSSCHGTVVSTSAGCTGAVVAESASCHSSSVASSCHGSSCHGSHAGIFGLRGKLFGGKSCHGSSCHGSTPVPSGSCYGSAPVATPDCNACPTAGTVITMPAATPVAAPVAMPKADDKPKSDEKPKDKPKTEDKPKNESN